MKKVNVTLGSMNAVKDFNAIVSKYACDIDLVSGRYVVDAKSIMGIYSLDLSQPIEVQMTATISLPSSSRISRNNRFRTKTKRGMAGLSCHAPVR